MDSENWHALATLVGKKMTGFVEHVDGSIELYFEGLSIEFGAISSLPHGGGEISDVETELQYAVRRVSDGAAV